MKNPLKKTGFRIFIYLLIGAMLLGYIFYIKSSYFQISEVNSDAVGRGVYAPKYTGQMADCKKIGGKIEIKTTNTGMGWEALSQWKCACQNDSVSFSDNLQCNQWFTPEI